MSVAELSMWQAYVAENGPLNMALRFEHTIARAVLPFLKKGTEPKLIAPFPREPEPEPADVPQAVHALFKRLASKPKVAKRGK